METEIIKERVQDGATGEYRDMAYTQCKIVGNGSFGVVFQTKLSPSGEDAAIKRVLQDKRFKVLKQVILLQCQKANEFKEPRITDYENRPPSEYCGVEGLLLLEW